MVLRKKHILLICFTIISFAFLASCKDDDSETKNEFYNWKSRNEAFFASVSNNAMSEIELAKKQYPDNWTEHCEWRAFQCYSKGQGSTANSKEDSIYVKIIKRGTGSGCPISTDSVRVFYAGWLIPSDSYPEGMMFDHSGQSNVLEKIFNHQISTPASMLITSQIRGFATALQYMHIGDIWRIYIPYKLGYDKSVSGSVPSYSTLIFNVELVQYARAGNKLPQWN